MAFFAWVNWLMSQMRHLRWSKFNLFCFLAGYLMVACRQRREHRVFTVLLQMVPNLEARLMEGSNENVVFIAEMVCLSFACLQRLLIMFVAPKGCIWRSI